MSSKETNLSNQSVSLTRMVGFAIGGTLASGLFYVPGDFASGGAHTLAVIIGWGICGIGTLALVGVYYNLGKSKPHLKSGLYAYAKDGFGSYMGFNMAWGYWISALLAQVTFAIALFTGLGQFFPTFGEGSTGTALVGQTAVIWLCVFLISRGVKEAFGINLVVVIAKLAPILTLIVAIIFSQHFKLDIFLDNYMGEGSGMNLLDQVKSTMFMTVWIFIGFESAIVASGRSKDAKTAGKATLIAFVCLLLIYMMISLLSMGVMSQPELAALEAPPMAGVLETVVGAWGAKLVSVAIIISVGGAMYSYTLLCAEACYMPAVEGTFPKFLAKQNKHGAPMGAVVITMLIVEIFLVIVMLNTSTYDAMYSMSTSMIILPYFTSALYYFKISMKKENLIYNEGGVVKKAFCWLIGILAVVYGAWMIYASGMQYLLVSALLYGPGIIIYYFSRKQNKKKLFENIGEVGLFIIITCAFVASIIMISNGTIKPF